MSQEMAAGDHQKIRLLNGLDVIFVRNCRLPLVAVNVCYHVGAANDPLGHGGLAHLCEHLMFEGSKNIKAGNHFRLLLSAGATEINATTQFDRTNYFETLPRQDLELALWLESDRMGFFLDALTSKKIATQRDVVFNERRDGEASPYFIIEDKVFELLFPAPHPYRNRIIGSRRDIATAGATQVVNFFRQYYCPNNASLAVIGDFDLEAAKASVQKYFQTLPEGPRASVALPALPPIMQERRAVVADEIEQNCVYMGWILDPIYQPGDAEAELISQILGNGYASRLHAGLVCGKRLADAVQTQYLSLKHGSIFQIQATARKGVSSEALQFAIDEELATLRDEGPSNYEVAVAVKAIETRMFTTLQRLGGFGGVADRLSCYDHYLGDPNYLSKDLERYRSATPAAIMRVAQQKLGSHARVLVFGVPGRKVLCEPVTFPSEGPSHSDHRVSGQSENWRSCPPFGIRRSTTMLPQFVTFTLANGLIVYVVEQQDIPVVSASLVALAGTGDNDPNLPGVASFTAQILRENAGSCSSLQTTQREQDIGAALQVICSVDDVSIGMTSLSSEINSAIGLISDTCLNPRFDPEDVERIRLRRCSTILRSNKYPPFVALDAFHERLYGLDHPYGAPIGGSISSNEQISGQHLVQFWRNFYVPNQAALVISGDIRAARALVLAERYFGHWRYAANKSSVPQVKKLQKGGLFILDMPDAVQAYLVIGALGIARSNNEYIAFQVLDNILCGLFTSRINTHLRQECGYTYSLSSLLSYYRLEGTCGVAGSIHPSAVGFAVKYILEEMKNLCLNPPRAEEISLAKNAIGLSLAGTFETNQQVVRSLSDLFTYALDADEYDTIVERLSAVSDIHLQELASRYFHHDSLLVVVVGDRSNIQAQLRASIPDFDAAISS